MTSPHLRSHRRYFVRALLTRAVPGVPCVHFVPRQEVNTVEAIWMKSPSEVDDAKYNEFYKFIAKAYDEPLAKVGRNAEN